jgi:multiple sugar transport system substrate-binding protein
MQKKICLLLALMLFALSFAGISFASPKSVVVAVNTSPWLTAFRDLAKKYEDEKGIKVDVRAFPFTGLPEKVLSACLSEESEFDVVTLAEGSVAKFYSGGFLEPIKNIEPGFKLDNTFISYNGLNYWDKKIQYTSKTGELYTFPINGNIQIFYYRKDLYDKAGLKAPKTWEDAIKTAGKLQNKNKGFYGYAVRGQKAVESVSWDWYSFLKGCGGDIFKNPPYNYTVTLNTPQAKKALELYSRLAKGFSPPGSSNIGQAEQIALLSSGKLLQTIVVAGAFAQVDDPKLSVVSGQIEYTTVPKPIGGVHAATSGTLSMGIPKNLPKERQKAALDFLKYVTSCKSQQYFAEHGGVPVRTDAMEDKGNKELRFLKAVKASADITVNMPRIKNFPTVDEVLETRLNEVVAGSLSVNQALKLMQKEITAIMKKDGYIK